MQIRNLDLVLSDKSLKVIIRFVLFEIMNGKVEVLFGENKSAE